MIENWAFFKSSMSVINPQIMLSHNTHRKMQLYTTVTFYSVHIRLNTQNFQVVPCVGEDELEDGVSALAVSMVGTWNMENENYLPTQLLYFWMDTPRTHNGVLKGCIPTSVLSVKCGSQLLLMDEGMKIYMSQSVSNWIPGQVPGPGVVD